MTDSFELPIASGLHALVAVATAIGRSLPAASGDDRRAWRALEPELHQVHRLAGAVSASAARETLQELLDVLLRFRAKIEPDTRPS